MDQASFMLFNYVRFRSVPLSTPNRDYRQSPKPHRSFSVVILSHVLSRISWDSRLLTSPCCLCHYSVGQLERALISSGTVMNGDYVALDVLNPLWANPRTWEALTRRSSRSKFSDQGQHACDIYDSNQLWFVAYVGSICIPDQILPSMLLAQLRHRAVFSFMDSGAVLVSKSESDGSIMLSNQPDQMNGPEKHGKLASVPWMDSLLNPSLFGCFWRLSRRRDEFTPCENGRAYQQIIKSSGFWRFQHADSQMDCCQTPVCRDMDW